MLCIEVTWVCRKDVIRPNEPLRSGYDGLSYVTTANLLVNDT